MPTKNEPVASAQLKTIVASYHILSSDLDATYDRFTRKAAEVGELPFSFLYFTDGEKHRIHAAHRIVIDESMRSASLFQDTASLQIPITIVDDAQQKQLFHNFKLFSNVDEIRFFASIPLLNTEGYCLGYLNVFHQKAHNLSPLQIELLINIGEQIVQALELRKTQLVLENTERRLEQLQTHHQDFAYIISHDLKAPLRNIKSLVDVLNEDYKEELSEVNDLLNLLSNAAFDASNMLMGLLTYSRATRLKHHDSVPIHLSEILPEIIQKLNVPDTISIKYTADYPIIHTIPEVLKHILTCLLSNAIKNQDKSNAWVEVKAEEDEHQYLITVEDNGQGIEANRIRYVTNLFYMVDKTDARKKGSLGIGLAIVAKLLEEVNGTMDITSVVQEYTKVVVSIPK